MFKKQLLILLLIFWAQHSSCFLDVLFEIVEKEWMLVQTLNRAKSTAENTGTNVVSFFTNISDHREIVEALEGMNHKLGDLKAYTEDAQNHIAVLMEHLPRELDILLKREEISLFIVNTNRLWEKLMLYIEHGGLPNMLLYLADDILVDLKSQLQHFRHVFTPETMTSPHDGLFMLLIKNADKKRDILCNPGETSHHSILRLFHIVTSIEIKAHTLLFLAHLLRHSKNDEWKVPLETGFKEQFNRTFDVVSKSLKIARLPYIRSCDPEIWQTDKNYYALYGYLQQTIYYLPECSSRRPPFCADLNEGKRTSEYWNRAKCFIVPLNNHAKCDGSPFACEEVNAVFQNLNTCAWENGTYRIRFVKVGSETFGTDKEAIASMPTDHPSVCPHGNDYTRPAISQGNGFACSCQCSRSRVKLMTSLTHSKVNDNCIIVGLRIHKVENYIYIQIAEGKLEANGYISNYSWVPSTRDIHSEWSLEEGLMSADKNVNLFFLGDGQLTPGHVLTGIQFSWQKIGKLSGFAVLMYGMEFNYKTGRLNRYERFRGPVQSGESHELKIPTKNPVNREAYERSSPKSDGYTHIYLQRSDLSDDYGQTTLPLLDGVPILTNPLSPIGGVGLFYKGYAEGYAGFLSLRLYPVNFTYFMETFKESHDVDSILNWNN